MKPVRFVTAGEPLTCKDGHRLVDQASRVYENPIDVALGMPSSGIVLEPGRAVPCRQKAHSGHFCCPNYVALLFPVEVLGSHVLVLVHVNPSDLRPFETATTWWEQADALGLRPRRHQARSA